MLCYSFMNLIKIRPSLHIRPCSYRRTAHMLGVRRYKIKTKMIEYIINNKEWIFSGVGVVIITFIISLVARNKSSSSTNKVKIKGSSNKVHQIGAKNENDIEIEGDMNDVNQP